jgi:hypothetical protein
MGMFLNRYVGGESGDGHVVRDTWTGEVIEKHASKSRAMDRVVEANEPYITAEIAVHGKRSGT